jgi:hypothetical protein
VSGSLRDARSNGAWRWAAAGAAALTLFAILFTAGVALGAWPQLPAGAFWGWDLWVGLAGGLIVLADLLRGFKVES